jgi:hypothetical protein
MPDDAFSSDSVVSWDEMTRAEAAAYEHALAEARVEDDMQRFLESHPQMLAQHLSGERLAWVMPRRRLGSEYVTEFLIAQSAAGRYSWCAVELERPQARMFSRERRSIPCLDACSASDSRLAYLACPQLWLCIAAA